MAGYTTRYDKRPPPLTIDDVMYEIQCNLWWGHKETAKYQILWLLERFLGDENEEATSETPVSQVSSSKGKAGEDDQLGSDTNNYHGYYTTGRRYRYENT